MANNLPRICTLLLITSTFDFAEYDVQHDKLELSRAYILLDNSTVCHSQAKAKQFTILSYIELEHVQSKQHI